MASISLGEIASITKKALEIINALASAPADLRKAQVKVSALKIYLSAISRERANPASKINKTASIRRDAELLLGFCLAQLEAVHAISRKYAGKGATMDLWTRTKWIAGDSKAWAEALSELEELRVELREYVRDVCIGVIGVNAVEAALDDTDDEEKAVATAIAKKNRKHPRAVSAEERAELVQFAQTVKAQRTPKPNPNGGGSAKPKPKPKGNAARLECWVLRTTSSPTGVTKTWKQEKRAQCTLRQTAKEWREAAGPKTITAGKDEWVQGLLKAKNGAEKGGEKAKWVFVVGRVVQRGFVGFGLAATETVMVVVRREVPMPKALKNVEGKGKEGKGKGTKDKDGKEKDAKEKNGKEKDGKENGAKGKEKDPKEKDAKQKDPKEKDGDKKAKEKDPKPKDPKDKDESKPKTPPAPKKSQTDCQYGSECTALDCKYKHPQRGPCRYGEDCKNDKCGFEHGARQCKFKVCRKAGCTFKHRAGQRGKVKEST